MIPQAQIARERGREAARKGKPITANKYAKPDLRGAWFQGHCEITGVSLEDELSRRVAAVETTHAALPPLDPDHAFRVQQSLLAETLHRALEAEGITQAELARRCDVARQEIGRIYATDGNPTLKTLCRLAHHLGCHVEIKFHRKAAREVGA